MYNEKKIIHLQMIQEIISRMASNSFAIKGWAVSLVAGVFVLSNKDADKSYFIVAYLPIIVFWLLDAYYLWRERLYRLLYDKIRHLSDGKIDFSMDTSFAKKDKTACTYVGCLFSKTIIGFYLSLLFVTSGVVVLTNIW